MAITFAAGDLAATEAHKVNAVKSLEVLAGKTPVLPIDEDIGAEAGDGKVALEDSISYLRPRESGHGQTRITASYFGGSGRDEVVDVQFAPDGTIVMAGMTTSNDIALPGGTVVTTIGSGGNVGNETGFIARFSNDGKTLLSYTRFAWGSVKLQNIAINASGIYVTGFANGTFNDLPGYSGAFEDGDPGGNWLPFIARLSSNAASMTAGSYISGSGNAQGLGAARDIKDINSIDLYSNGDVLVAYEKKENTMFDYVSRFDGALQNRVWHLWNNYSNTARWGSAKSTRTYIKAMCISADEEHFYITGYSQGNTGLEPYKMPYLHIYRSTPLAINADGTVDPESIRLAQVTNPNGTLNGMEQGRYGYPDTAYGWYDVPQRLIGDNRMISDSVGRALAPASDGTILASLSSDGGASLLMHDPLFPGFTLNGDGALPSAVVGGDNWSNLGGATGVSIVGRMKADHSTWERVNRFRGTEDNVGAVNPFNRMFDVQEMYNGKVLVVGQGRDISDVNEWEYGSGAGSVIVKLKMDGGANIREFVTHIAGVSAFRAVARQGETTRYAVVGDADSGDAVIVDGVQATYAGNGDAFLLVFDDDDLPADNIGYVSVDADAGVFHQQPDTAFGTDEDLWARWRDDYGTHHSNKNSKMLLRFDMTGVTRPITEVRLQGYGGKYANGDFHVYGLKDGQDGWDEALITYNTAPGVGLLVADNRVISNIDANDVVDLGPWSLTNIIAEQTRSFSSPALNDFVIHQAGNDGLITILIVPTERNDNGLDFRSKESFLLSDVVHAPRLRLRYAN